GRCGDRSASKRPFDPHSATLSQRFSLPRAEDPAVPHPCAQQADCYLRVSRKYRRTARAESIAAREPASDGGAHGATGKPRLGKCYCRCEKSACVRIASCRLHV